MAASAAVCWELEDRDCEASDYVNCKLKKRAMIFLHVSSISVRSVPIRTHVGMACTVILSKVKGVYSTHGME